MVFSPHATVGKTEENTARGKAELPASMVPKPELFVPGLVTTKGSTLWQRALFYPVSAVAPTGPSVLEGAPQLGERLAWAQGSMNWTIYQQHFLVSQVWRLPLETLASGGRAPSEGAGWAGASALRLTAAWGVHVSVSKFLIRTLFFF